MSDFDDLFKSRFEEHEVEVPSNMWDRIQEAQAPDDVRKPIYFYWKVGVASLFILGLSIISYSLVNPQVEEAVTNIDERYIIDLSSQISPKQKEDLSSLLKASEDNIESVEKVISVYSQNNPIKTKAKSQKVNKISSIISSNIEVKESDLINDIDDLNDIDGLRIDNTISESNVKESSILAHSKSIKKRVEFPTALLSHLSGNNKIAIPDMKLADRFLMPEYDSKCPKFGNTVHGYFSVEAYHSYDNNIRRFEAKQEESQDYLAVREQSEIKQYSYSNGVKFKWHNNSGLSLGVGVERSVIRELFEFVNEDSREVKILISIDTLFDSSGGFTTTRDTTRVELAGVTRNVFNNSYTSIDLPINIGYQVELNRWAIGFNAGLHVNLLFSQTGRILGFDRQPAWISSGADNELDIYQAKSGLKFDGSISVIYHLTPNLDIMAEPYFRYNRNTITRDNSPLNQYYNTMGIRTGVRYNFGF